MRIFKQHPLVTALAAIGIAITAAIVGSRALQRRPAGADEPEPTAPEPHVLGWDDEPESTIPDAPVDESEDE